MNRAVHLLSTCSLCLLIAWAIRPVLGQIYPSDPDAVRLRQRGPQWRRRPPAPEIKLEETDLPRGQLTTVLIRFGLKDTAPVDWSGELRSRGAHVVRVRPWRFAPGMTVRGTTWQCSTWWGPPPQNRVFDQHLPGNPWPFIRPGILVDLDDIQPDAELAVFTKSYGARIKLRDILRKGRVTVLRGRFGFELAVFGTPGGVGTLNGTLGPECWHDWPSVLAPAADGEPAWLAFQTYVRGKGDHLVVRQSDGGSWGAPRVLKAPSNDLYRTALGRDAQGTIWLVISAQVNGNWDLYGYRYQQGDWHGPQRLTQHPHPDMHHLLVTDSDGQLWLVWQGFRDGQSDILARCWDGQSWSPEVTISTSARNDWEPHAAAYPGGGIAVVWDSYEFGNYDVFARIVRREKGEISQSRVYQVTSGSWREARATVACDGAGRLWIAFDKGTKHWGKDTGFWLELKRLPQGGRLYEHRWIEMRVLNPRTGEITQPPGYRPAEALNANLLESAERPLLVRDSRGNLWLFYRRYTCTDRSRRGVAWRFVWELRARRYNPASGTWHPEMLFADSAGRLDALVSVSPSARHLWAAWTTDHRTILGARPDAMSVFTGMIPLDHANPRGSLRSVRGKPAPFLAPEPDPVHANEPVDLERIRSYRIRVGDLNLRILRGDMHRHTENSQDGGNEGSLIDVYRYALDAAALDFLLVTDHNDGFKHYQWWIREKSNDLFHVPPTFVTLYGYERSVSYPNGHRNVFLLKRGVEPLMISPEEFPRRGRPPRNSGAILYPYLRKNQGICFSHTSATGMGTNWRDNDPEVEPLVEIFQGDRTNYEMIGAPWAADPEDQTTHEGGFRPLGFVVHALAKGYKLGFQASSDHLSTHLSYSCILAPENSREALFAAMKQRHSYAATDNIIVDVRADGTDRPALMGDIVPVQDKPRLRIYVRGTRPVRTLTIVRNGEIVFSCTPDRRTVALTYTDDTPPDSAEVYYYIRVQQEDERLAWSSPIWFTRSDQ